MFIWATFGRLNKFPCIIENGKLGGASQCIE